MQGDAQRPDVAGPTRRAAPHQRRVDELQVDQPPRGAEPGQRLPARDQVRDGRLGRARAPAGSSRMLLGLIARCTMPASCSSCARAGGPGDRRQPLTPGHLPGRAPPASPAAGGAWRRRSCRRPWPRRASGPAGASRRSAKSLELARPAASNPPSLAGPGSTLTATCRLVDVRAAAASWPGRPGRAGRGRARAGTRSRRRPSIARAPLLAASLRAAAARGSSRTAAAACRRAPGRPGAAGRPGPVATGVHGPGRPAPADERAVGRAAVADQHLPPARASAGRGPGRCCAPRPAAPAAAAAPDSTAGGPARVAADDVVPGHA